MIRLLLNARCHNCKFFKVACTYGEDTAVGRTNTVITCANANHEGYCDVWNVFLDKEE